MYKQLLKLSTVTATIVSSATLASNVLAQGTVALPSNPAKSVPSFVDLPAKIVNLFIPGLLSIVGFLAIFYLFRAGIQFARSNGDPKLIADARARIIFVIVGLVIIILAAVATQLINQLLLGNTSAI